MKKTKLNLKIFTLMLSLLLTLPFLASCSQNKTIVGTVDGKDVYYDELYYLASYYGYAAQKEAGDNTELECEKLDTWVKESIVNNYALLALCEQNGLKYEDIEDQLDNEFDSYLDDYIKKNFAGKKSYFRNSGISERYVRFECGLGLLSQKLLIKYIEDGKLLTNENEIKEYINKNFIRVNHLVQFNDENDTDEVNLAKMTEAKALLDGGESVHTLIGKGYSEDFYNISKNAYYITIGTMDATYETTAFDLKVGEHSNIIKSYGENSSGEYSPCYYIIERLPMEDEYIEKNFETLKDEYFNSILNKDIAELRANLEFVPNEKYNRIDLVKLQKPTDMTVIIIIAVILAVIVAILVTIIIIKSSHKKKNVSYKLKAGKRK